MSCLDGFVEESGLSVFERYMIHMYLMTNSKTKSDSKYLCGCAQHTHILYGCAHSVRGGCGRLLYRECACGKIPSVRCAQICPNKKAQNIDIFETKTI